MRPVDRQSAISFLNQLRAARLAALADSEAFEGIIHSVERLGCYLNGRLGDLGKYKAPLRELVQLSWLAQPNPEFRSLLIPFSELYELVRVARNDALHQGSSARHLTRHAVELAIILEDALSSQVNPIIGDFMIRNPTCAELWQPIGFVRQQMLANSYSYLPVLGDKDSWCVVSDASVARFLGAERSGRRKAQLAKTLREAYAEDKDILHAAAILPANANITEALARLKDHSVVLVSNDPNGEATPSELLGIVTAFDLL